MTLPALSKGKPIWIEVTRAEHEHGGDGWEFGTCLWSPSAAKPEPGSSSGRDIYRPMREVQSGDLILHFYHNTWERKGGPHFRLCAYSYAAAPVQETKAEPPKAADWAGRPTYYRIELRDFTELEETLSVPEFLTRHAKELREERGAGVPRYYPFIEYPGRGLQLAQGTYLAVCTPHVYSLFTSILGQAPGASADVHPSAGQQQEFVEGMRLKREVYFFSRNPALVLEAKRRYGYKCKACAFDFEQVYGELGRHYIECHHLNPMSERSSYQGSPALTKIEDVVVLCANCHRMVHKRRPPLTLEELRTLLRARSGQPLHP